MFINIEIERLRRHMTKTALAQALDVPVLTLNEWITRRRAIPADKLRLLVGIFNGCSLDYLLKR